MKPTARDGVAHIGTEFSIGSAAVHIKTARPGTERIDLCGRKKLLQPFEVGVALTDNDCLSVLDAFAVRMVSLVEFLCESGEQFLFSCDRDTSEDAVVTAAHSSVLIGGEIFVLRILPKVYLNLLSGDPMNGRCDVVIGEDYGGFADDVTDAVTDEDFDGDSRISFFGVGKVNDRSGASVGGLAFCAPADLQPVFRR